MKGVPIMGLRKNNSGSRIIGNNGETICMVKKTVFEKEWIKLEKAEQKYFQKNADKEDTKLNRMLAEKVPENLQGTLDAAFFKAFTLVFETGTGVIEKTYNKDKLQRGFRVNEYAAGIKEDRKTLKSFSKSAAQGKNLNLLLSGVSGVGLGVLGVGLPDIVLFTGLVLEVKIHKKAGKH